MKSRRLKIEIEKLLEEYPFVQMFFDDNGIDIAPNQSASQIFENLTDEELEKHGGERETLEKKFLEYIDVVSEALGIGQNQVEYISILAGFDKSRVAENFSEIKLMKGDIVSIVGPTGSGKSRLLADIEWLADRDTPTNRKILINGETPVREMRFKTGAKLVAQLSQNMNFVMDLTVKEFIEIHAASRLIDDIEKIQRDIIEQANMLAGEKFDLNTPITALSGGQSRALMIADTAILSKSPIVLIDEIENAGIDRKKALDLLIGEGKIVLISTHDPILSLMSDKRLIIENGGIKDVIEIDDIEKKSLERLVELDDILMNQRTKLRMGERIIL